MVWPPSKPGLGMPWWPVRAFWPFWPLPEVLCRPEPWPRPRRFLLRFAPGFGFSVCSVVPMCRISVGALRGRLDLHQVRDLADHAPDGRSVVERDRLVKLRQPQTADGVLLILRAVDAAADQRDLELKRHARSPIPSR